MTFYASSELDVTLEVESTRFRVAHFGAVFTLNQIPQASCILEIGREALAGNKSSKVHTQLSKLKKGTRCKVYFRGYGEYSPNIAWPDKETVIFEGYITGTGFQKSGGNVQYSVNIMHWLYDLDCTSAISKYSHVTNNTKYTFQAIVNPASTSDSEEGEGASGDGDGIYMLYQSDLCNVITVDTVADDFWGQALKPIFCRMAEEKHVQFATETFDCLGELEGYNKLALQALKKIEGVSDRKDTDLAYSCYTPKLSFSPAEEGKFVPFEVAEAVQELVGRDMVGSFAGQTAWTKLLSYGSTFFFSVIPQAEHALVVPLCCGTRDTYCKVISINDYDFIRLPATINRPLRAIGVWSGLESDAGLMTGEGEDAKAAGIMGLGGCFAPADATVQDGMVLFVDAPAWLYNVSSIPYSAEKTSGTKAEVEISTATTPIDGEPKEEIKGHEKGTKPADVFLSVKHMYDRYAQAFYVLEALRGREGNVAGKLRFDIAPGSTVKVEVAGEQHAEEDQDDLAGVFVGCVVSVSIDINAESGKAGTGFTLKHVRSEAENKSDLTSIEHHPLYTTLFLGAPLVPDLAFAEEGTDCCFGDA
jgi:hypothetical protein